MRVVIFVLALSVTIPALMAADPGGVQPLNPKFAAYGKTYSEWSAEWWQWVFSIPVSSNPLVDKGDCSVGQSGPVWFLGGKFYILVPDAPAGRNAPATATVTRNCSVPAGTALFFPVANISVTAPEEPDWGCGNSLPPLVSGTISEMRQCISLYLTTTGLAAEIDGHAIPNIEKYRVQSPEFTVTFPEDNLLTALGEGPFPAGTYSPTVADGFYLLLPPLSPGHHTLHIQQGAAQSITYNLTIGY